MCGVVCVTVYSGAAEGSQTWEGTEQRGPKGQFKARSAKVRCPKGRGGVRFLGKGQIVPLPTSYRVWKSDVSFPSGRRNRCLGVFNPTKSIYTVSQKRFPPLNSLQLCQVVTDFQNVCTVETWKRTKFAANPIQHYPPHLRHVATLTWEIKHSDVTQIFSRNGRKCKQIAFLVQRF